ncbi:hypothetical protein [Chryseobacterium vrystaatense]|uniref:Uncharacterized protein n=1 Tax=Chryseobacterium vrystaatense TaxID=307480 RepID=A0A1M5G1K5_9FLAO|nr:hypothetical protein [Chryseobacterium vrystaatense]SHF97608.1 hypothetical protein SAMN02787073_3203 [Chryseobacterium vrystaatense]
MIKRIVITAVTALSCSLTAQEFATYKNGFIYGEETMNKLGKIVDSLNLKYKTCDLNQVFDSKLQTKGYSVVLKSGPIAQAKKDMDMNISFDDFMKKYPEAVVKKDLLLIKSKAKNYQDKDIIEITEISVNDDNGMEIEIPYKKELYTKPAKNKWVYSYSKKTSYSEEYIEAFYLLDNFKSIPLAPKYSRQIIYSDCLIDTSLPKLKKDAKEGRLPDGIPQNIRKLSKTEKEKLLDDFRSVHVVGLCSQDNSPRVQGVYLALLSAETANWPVFLKSHLDIMNDRFDRSSDSSYARERRQTYIKELETLNINVPDLILGTSFRIENPANNHYYANISRSGRAVAESKDRELFLSQLLSMMGDETLDDYNRIISYFFYVSCNHYIKNEREKKINNIKLMSAVQKLPKYLADQIKPKKI